MVRNYVRRDVDSRSPSQINSQSWCTNKLCPFQYYWIFHTFVFVVSDGAKEEQGDVTPTARVSCDPGAAVRGTKEATGTDHQCRDQEQVCHRWSQLVASLASCQGNSNCDSPWRKDSLLDDHHYEARHVFFFRKQVSISKQSLRHYSFTR